MQKILEKKLQLLAKICLWRFRPRIVAITGNVGKTSAKEAIAMALSGRFKVRASGGNLNNELGVPMSILGDWSNEYYEKGGTPWLWLKVLLGGLWQAFFSFRYPEVLVLEYGAGKPGDIKLLAKTYKPDIAVVTAVGETPVHVEFFASPKELAEEKAHLLRVLSATDSAVLNFDDLTVLEMKEKTKAKTLTFGFGEGAGIRATNFDTVLDQSGVPHGVSFKLHYGGGFVPVAVSGSLGRAQAMAVAAAAAVGIHMGMNLVQVSDALKGFSGPAGRLRLLKGIKGSLVLDDTYNAAPASTHMAMETLKELPLQQVQGKQGRKVAVLGDMLELGKHSTDAHRAVGDLAGPWLSALVCVGERARFIMDSAQNEMPEGKIFWFHNSDEAKIKVQELLEPGDVVLVKGSQGKRMEKIVEEIMAEPERKKELLVRQSRRWLEK